MAYRGRGRGRGYGGWGGHSFAKPEAFVLFPEDVVLPDAKVDDIDANVKRLLNWNNKMKNYWKASPYFLEDTNSKKRQRLDVERFSDKQKAVFTRDSLSQVLEFKDFPKELVQGTRRIPKRKSFRWNPESDLKTLDLFEQLEKKAQSQGDKGEKEKKEGEDEDEDEDAENEEAEEELSDDDYNQNEYFDDDEDDYNDVDEGEDDGIY